MAGTTGGPDMQIIAYLRVSTTEQADSGAGLAAQRAAILTEAQRRGWDQADVHWIEDAGFSAKSMNRPGLAIALAALKRGDTSVLVVSKMDRLSRSLLDFAAIMQRAQREGWALVALDSPADLTTPSGEAMAGVMAVFAQLERRLIGERTKAALAQRKAAGVRLGRPRAIPAAVEARARALKADGLTVRAIASQLAAEGHQPPNGGQWQPSTLHRVLTRTAAA
jgi:DNA invertase Pin-like site-specific DNA recombinase